MIYNHSVTLVCTYKKLFNADARKSLILANQAFETCLFSQLFDNTSKTKALHFTKKNPNTLLTNHQLWIIVY